MMRLDAAQGAAAFSHFAALRKEDGSQGEPPSDAYGPWLRQAMLAPWRWPASIPI
jgi:hypothetical protein